MTASDKKFVKKAYKGGMEEVENGKMAKEKAKDDATKNVAERMITDHTKVNEELLNIAKEENLDLSKVHAKTATISGGQLRQGISDNAQGRPRERHRGVRKGGKRHKAGEDRDVPAFAKKTLPT